MRGFKVFLFMIVLATLAQAATLQRRSRIGPTRATASVTIAAPWAGVRNCINELDVTSDAAYTVNVLDGGTTVYAVALSSAAGLVRSWDDISAPCASANAIMYINVTAGNMNISYSGFTY